MDKRPPPIIHKNILKGEPIKTDPVPDHHQNHDHDLSFTERYHLFLYGTLMDLATLCKALKLRDPGPGPAGILRPAKIIGNYACTLWGEYPALLALDDHHDGDSCTCACSNEINEVEVHGMAYEVRRSPTEARRRLIEYETEKYRLERCLIYFEKDRKDYSRPVIGSTFVWNADRALLKEGGSS